MAFKHPFWRPAAVVFSGLNLVAAGFAMAQSEPLHAGTHVVVALLSAWWAQWLYLRRLPGDTQTRLGEGAARMEQFEMDISSIRRELVETQERLDFVERVLAQSREGGRIGGKD